MTRLPNKKTVLLALAVVAVLGGATAAAVTAAQPASRPRAVHRAAPRSGARAGMLALAASYLGLSPAQLRGELRAGKSLAQVAEARGKPTAGLVQALEGAAKARLAARAASLHERVNAAVNRTGRRGRLLGAAASYLGLTVPTLRDDLRAGRSLAQVAASTPGRSVAGLIGALVAARKATLQSEASSGAITQARADALAARLQRRVSTAVERVHHARPAPSHARR
jgi:hypothetical protein